MRQTPHVRERVLADRADGRDQLVDLLLRLRERLGAGGLLAGDDHGIVHIVVQAGEAEVTDGPSWWARRRSTSLMQRAVVISEERPGRPRTATAAGPCR